MLSRHHSAVQRTQPTAFTFRWVEGFGPAGRDLSLRAPCRRPVQYGQATSVESARRILAEQGLLDDDEWAAALDRI